MVAWRFATLWLALLAPAVAGDALTDRADAAPGRRPNARGWRAVASGRSKVRPPADDPVGVESPLVVDRPELLAAFRAEEPAAPLDLPAEVNAELASIAAEARSIRSSQVDRWDLDPIRVRYDALMRRSTSNPEVKAAVQSRLEQTLRDIELAHAAERFASLLREGDDRDAKIGQLQRSVAEARTRSERNYDAQGLLQASSRRYQGQKVHALIGPEGKPVGYLAIPPGVPVARFLARRVGVRGVVHYDEELGARLISVRDLEAIDRIR